MSNFSGALILYIRFSTIVKARMFVMNRELMNFVRSQRCSQLFLVEAFYKKMCRTITVYFFRQTTELCLNSPISEQTGTAKFRHVA